jgi:hypothetical protein
MLLPYNPAISFLDISQKNENFGLSEILHTMFVAPLILITKHWYIPKALQQEND